MAVGGAEEALFFRGCSSRLVRTKAVNFFLHVSVQAPDLLYNGPGLWGAAVIDQPFRAFRYQEQCGHLQESDASSDGEHYPPETPFA